VSIDFASLAVILLFRLFARVNSATGSSLLNILWISYADPLGGLKTLQCLLASLVAILLFLPYAQASLSTVSKLIG